MLTLLFTMFSNYCRQGSHGTQGGDTPEVVRSRVHLTATSLGINKGSACFYRCEESSQRTLSTRGYADLT